MAGVHRALLVAAAIKAMLTKTSFDDQLAWIGTVRRIEPHKITHKKSNKLMMWWLQDLANRQTFQSVLIQLLVVLARSDTPSGGILQMAPISSEEGGILLRHLVGCPGAALVFQTAKQALHMGQLGACENGDRNVLREAMDFAVDREFLAAIYDDFQRVLDECAPQIADKITDCAVW
eukprot:s73_g39.t1